MFSEFIFLFLYIITILLYQMDLLKVALDMLHTWIRIIEYNRREVSVEFQIVVCYVRYYSLCMMR